MLLLLLLSNFHAVPVGSQPLQRSIDLLLISFVQLFGARPKKVKLPFSQAALWRLLDYLFQFLLTAVDEFLCLIDCVLADSCCSQLPAPLLISS